MLTHLPFRYITGLVKGVFCALLITLFSCSLRMPDNIKFPPGANAVDILERFALRTFAKILAVMMSQHFFFFGFHSNRSSSLYVYIGRLISQHIVFCDIYGSRIKIKTFDYF